MELDPKYQGPHFELKEWRKLVAMANIENNTFYPPHPNHGTEGLLAERSKTHGDYKLTAKVAREIMEAAFWGPSELSPEQYIAISMIAVKIARIVCGNPNAQEHWDDIAGYAKLVSMRCTK